jgi:hypothetical protein
MSLYKKKYDWVTRSKIKDVLSYNFTRVSIVPYYTRKYVNYYYLGIDTKYWSTCDLGGLCSKDENFVIGAIRELKEETLGVFNITNAQHIIDNSTCIYDSEVMIIFQKINIDDPFLPCEIYRELYEKAILNNIEPSYLENSYLIIISEENLKQLVNDEDVELPENLSLLINKSNNSIHMHRTCSSLLNFNKDDIDEHHTFTKYPPLYNRIKKLLLKYLINNTSLLT